MSYHFGREYRLLKTDDFSSVFAFRKSRSNSFFQVFCAPNGLSHARLGLVVSKKVARFAHERNYMKRSVREWFRQNKQDLPCVDYIVRSKQKFTHAEQKDAIIALTSLMQSKPLCLE